MVGDLAIEGTGLHFVYCLLTKQHFKDKNLNDLWRDTNSKHRKSELARRPPQSP